MRVVGLFSGIGGLELPFKDRGSVTELLCDVWEPSQKVLKAHFPGVQVKDDIAKLRTLPKGVNVVTAGFPCTDLSQAGRTAGIRGEASGLVAHVFRLLKKRDVEWLVLENVRNMLVLDRGQAMHYLTTELETLGFRWAYRLVDSRFTGVPQRRHRVLLVASRHHDPRRVLFADEAGEPAQSSFRSDAFGFYWTEGARGLGWAPDAVPPLKGGSTVGIASPPAVWIPGAKLGRKIVTPTIEDAEALQGFERGWTLPAEVNRTNGPRWKLIGNAVTVGVADWLVGRLLAPGEVCIEEREMPYRGRWPAAAYGAAGKIWQFDASHWPQRRRYRHLTSVLTLNEVKPLSARATWGFFNRAYNSPLDIDKDFLRDVEKHAEFMDNVETPRTRARAAAA
jgi:DNA (cytosine-5)-methyltransferase 1